METYTGNNSLFARDFKINENKNEEISSYTNPKENVINNPSTKIDNKKNQCIVYVNFTFHILLLYIIWHKYKMAGVL